MPTTVYDDLVKKFLEEVSLPGIQKLIYKTNKEMFERLSKDGKLLNVCAIGSLVNPLHKFTENRLSTTKTQKTDVERITEYYVEYCLEYAALEEDEKIFALNIFVMLYLRDPRQKHTYDQDTFEDFIARDDWLWFVEYVSDPELDPYNRELTPEEQRYFDKKEDNTDIEFIERLMKTQIELMKNTDNKAKLAIMSNKYVSFREKMEKKYGKKEIEEELPKTKSKRAQLDEELVKSRLQSFHRDCGYHVDFDTLKNWRKIYTAQKMAELKEVGEQVYEHDKYYEFMRTHGLTWGCVITSKVELVNGFAVKNEQCGGIWKTGTDTYFERSVEMFGKTYAKMISSVYYRVHQLTSIYGEMPQRIFIDYKTPVEKLEMIHSDTAEYPQNLIDTFLIGEYYMCKKQIPKRPKRVLQISPQEILGLHEYCWYFYNTVMQELGWPQIDVLPMFESCTSEPLRYLFSYSYRNGIPDANQKDYLKIRNKRFESDYEYAESLLQKISTPKPTRRTKRSYEREAYPVPLDKNGEPVPSTTSLILNKIAPSEDIRVNIPSSTFCGVLRGDKVVVVTGKECDTVSVRDAYFTNLVLKQEKRRIVALASKNKQKIKQKNLTAEEKAAIAVEKFRKDPARKPFCGKLFVKMEKVHMFSGFALKESRGRYFVRLQEILEVQRFGGILFKATDVIYGGEMRDSYSVYSELMAPKKERKRRYEDLSEKRKYLQLYRDALRGPIESMNRDMLEEREPFSISDETKKHLKIVKSIHKKGEMSKYYDEYSKNVDMQLFNRHVKSNNKLLCHKNYTVPRELEKEVLTAFEPSRRIKKLVKQEGRNYQHYISTPPVYKDTIEIGNGEYRPLDKMYPQKMHYSLGKWRSVENPNKSRSISWVNPDETPLTKQQGTHKDKRLYLRDLSYGKLDLDKILLLMKETDYLPFNLSTKNENIIQKAIEYDIPEPIHKAGDEEHYYNISFVDPIKKMYHRLCCGLLKVAINEIECTIIPNSDGTFSLKATEKIQLGRHYVIVFGRVGRAFDTAFHSDPERQEYFEFQIVVKKYTNCKTFSHVIFEESETTLIELIPYLDNVEISEELGAELEKRRKAATYLLDRQDWVLDMHTHRKKLKRDSRIELTYRKQPASKVRYDVSDKQLPMPINLDKKLNDGLYPARLEVDEVMVSELIKNVEVLQREDPAYKCYVLNSSHGTIFCHIKVENGKSEIIGGPRMSRYYSGIEIHGTIHFEFEQIKFNTYFEKYSHRVLRENWYWNDYLEQQQEPDYNDSELGLEEREYLDKTATDVLLKSYMEEDVELLEQKRIDDELELQRLFKFYEDLALQPVVQKRRGAGRFNVAVKRLTREQVEEKHRSNLQFQEERRVEDFECKKAEIARLKQTEIEKREQRIISIKLKEEQTKRQQEARKQEKIRETEAMERILTHAPLLDFEENVFDKLAKAPDTRTPDEIRRANEEYKKRRKEYKEKVQREKDEEERRLHRKKKSGEPDSVLGCLFKIQDEQRDQRVQIKRFIPAASEEGDTSPEQGDTSPEQDDESSSGSEISAGYFERNYPILYLYNQMCHKEDEEKEAERIRLDALAEQKRLESELLESESFESEDLSDCSEPECNFDSDSDSEYMDVSDSEFDPYKETF